LNEIFKIDVDMKWWKLVWVATLILWIGYLIYIYFDNRLSWELILTGIIIVGSGLPFLNKK
tara:strand:+ start:634 stop:816 length:183 start_codon:yes stop_codon:yes gene_type:complete